MQEPTIYRAPVAAAVEFDEAAKRDDRTADTAYTPPAYPPGYQSTTIIESLAGKDYHDFVIPEGETTTRAVSLPCAPPRDD